MVGHSLKEDFAHLKLNEEEYSCEIRDISEISFFKRKNCSSEASGSPVAACISTGCNSPSTCHHVGPYNPFVGQKRKLKELAEDYLNAKIQTGHHSSIIDARVALALYRTFQMFIEQENNLSPQGEFSMGRRYPSRKSRDVHPQDMMTDLDDFNLSPVPMEDAASKMLLASMQGQPAVCPSSPFFDFSFGLCGGGERDQAISQNVSLIPGFYGKKQPKQVIESLVTQFNH